ncbi:hypothetical protein OXPF_36700 [Oxobacter pfennigii]|uniref:DUF2232 domain-containing protein n=1 Tax=Oxobacter pfennigii TaxID=36849 RepID=A0A0P8W4Y2_9CLOT|nr:YybS family protein [Oxobacter pfennigii]KPU42901.1 hypothetical protein OXPF_36700 [Oxobacter pfennigii]
MKNLNTRALVEASLLVALAAVIMLLSAYVPFFILVGVIIWPIPITLLTFKYDLKVSILSMTALLILVSGLIDPYSAFTMGLMYGIPAIVLGFCLKKKYTPFTTVVAMSITMFLAYIAIIQFGAMLMGMDVLKEYFTSLEMTKEMAREMYIKFGMDASQVDQVLDQGLNPEQIRMLLPGLFAITALFGSYMNYYVVGQIFKRLRIDIVRLSPIEEWYIGRNLSFGLFFTFAVTGILYYFKVPNSDMVFNSMYMIFSLSFIVNGLAVVVWYIKSKVLSRKIRAIIYCGMVLYIPLLSQVFLIVGLVDYLFDFRKINLSRWGGRIPPGE